MPLTVTLNDGEEVLVLLALAKLKERYDEGTAQMGPKGRLCETLGKDIETLEKRLFKLKWPELVNSYERRATP